MASRIGLQTTLEELLEARHVYYQPPENVKMEYPAIRYSKKKPDTRHANNKVYMRTNCYEIIVISRNPDEPVIGKIEELPMCEWDNHYVSDNLHHDVFTLYF